MWTCKRCGTENSTGVCQRCGYQRPDRRERPLDDGDVEELVGRWYDYDEPDDEELAPERSRMPVKYIIGCIVAGLICVVAIVACVYLLFGNPFGPREGGQQAILADTPTVSALPSETPTIEPTASPAPTPEATASPLATPSPSLTPSPTATPSATPASTKEADWLEALVLEGRERNYTRSELKNMSEYQLMILRNGMFALSGKRFSRNQKVIDFFSACDWYEPKYSEDADAQAKMNDYQKSNLNLIIEVEKDKGYR